MQSLLVIRGTEREGVLSLGLHVWCIAVWHLCINSIVLLLGALLSSPLLFHRGHTVAARKRHTSLGGPAPFLPDQTPTVRFLGRVVELGQLGTIEIIDCKPAPGVWDRLNADKLL
ncbi:MAG: hypothetical protein EBV06_03975 [Planctomycetia bacterium]|nr:hypothetical protein [Planctomycetia bacterium]